jgi:hypothetical protein
MTFLQPLLLLALPLIAMPLVIHLLNQRRHQTIEWAAMHFLRKAKRLNTGVAKLRYWLIMALRTAAVAGVILALSRPISTGWLGSVGTSDRAVLIVLDRSPSMELQDSKSQQSKRQVALQRLDALFQTTSSRSRRFLLTTGLEGPKEILPHEKLVDLAESTPTAASTDLPGLLEKGMQSIAELSLASVDIWVCSDLQSSDWSPSDGRWQSIKERLTQNPNVRLLSLHYPARDDPNLSVSVGNLQRIENLGVSELSLEIQVRQTSGAMEPKTVPVTIHLPGTRRTVEVELQGTEARLGDVRIPLESNAAVVSGFVELPPDANPADDTYHFVTSPPAVQTALLVAESPAVGDLLEVALSTPPDDDTETRVQRIAMSEVTEQLSLMPRLIVWQGAITGKQQSDFLKRYLARGGRLFLFPSETDPAQSNIVSQTSSQPEDPDSPGSKSQQSSERETGSQNELGFSVGAWQSFDDPAAVQTWRTESDIVRNTSSGESLPLGDIALKRWFPYQGSDLLSLAKIQSGKSLLSKRSSDAGVLYLCHTLPTEDSSNLAEDGVCLYILMQRALADSDGDENNSGSVEAGSRRIAKLEDWRACDERSEKNLPWERWLQPGAYRFEDQLVAINRSTLEDTSPALRESDLSQLLQGTGFQLLQDDTGSDQSLAKEVWRVFIVLMILFLIGEAYLSLPSKFVKSKQRELVTLSPGSAWQLPADGGTTRDRSAASTSMASASAVAAAWGSETRNRGSAPS